MSETKIGELIAALRKSNGYTQQEVAERLGVSNKTVSSWETGASCPDISLLPAIAELYGVTCDEILCGKRLPANDTQKNQQSRREKALALLLQRQKTNIVTLCWISGGLTALGILLSMLVGYAALESLIGFFVGTIPLLGSAVAAAIVLHRIRFAIGEEFQSANAERVSATADRALLWILCANIAALAFIAPHATAPVHTGLTFGWEWLGTELACGAGGLFLSLLVGIPLYLHRRKKILLAAAAAEKETRIAAAAYSANELARWKYKNILLLLFLPIAIAAIITLCLVTTASQFVFNSVYSTNYVFDTLESLSALSGPFAEREYTLVSEEAEETDRVAVTYFFADFPEEWRKYYRTEDTEGGTLVTIYKYRFDIQFQDGIASHEFYAYDYLWQGGIGSIDAIGNRFTDTDGEEIVSDLTIFLYNVVSLYDQREAEELAGKQDILVWSAVAVGLAGAGSLAITIPVYRKKLHAFCRK